MTYLNSNFGFTLTFYPILKASCADMDTVTDNVMVRSCHVTRNTSLVETNDIITFHKYEIAEYTKHLGNFREEFYIIDGSSLHIIDANSKKGTDILLTDTHIALSPTPMSNLRLTHYPVVQIVRLQKISGVLGNYKFKATDGNQFHIGAFQFNDTITDVYLKKLRIFDVIVLKDFWVKKLERSITTDFWYVLDFDIVDDTHDSQVSSLSAREQLEFPDDDVPSDMKDQPSNMKEQSDMKDQPSNTKEHSQVTTDVPPMFSNNSMRQLGCQESFETYTITDIQNMGRWKTTCCPYHDNLGKRKSTTQI